MPTITTACGYIIGQDVMKRHLVLPADSLLCLVDAWLLGLTPEQEAATPPIKRTLVL